MYLTYHEVAVHYIVAGALWLCSLAPGPLSPHLMVPEALMSGTRDKSGDYTLS